MTQTGDDLRAYVERDPDHAGEWRWWVTEDTERAFYDVRRSVRLTGGRNGEALGNRCYTRRGARRAARKALEAIRERRDAQADPQREEIR